VEAGDVFSKDVFSAAEADTVFSGRPQVGWHCGRCAASGEDASF
jgi:hypothetical protein